SAAAMAALRSLYPLRHIVVRMTDPELSEASRQAWLDLRRTTPPGLRFRGTFGDTDLYELLPLPERGAQIQRLVSYSFLQEHPRLRLVVRPLIANPNLEQWVEVLLNGKLLERAPLTTAATVTTQLGRRLSRVVPNVITLRYAARRPVEASDAPPRSARPGPVAGMVAGPIEEQGFELMEFEMRR